MAYIVELDVCKIGSLTDLTDDAQKLHLFNHICPSYLLWKLFVYLVYIILDHFINPQPSMFLGPNVAFVYQLQDSSCNET
jgi:hypothetical protein